MPYSFREGRDFSSALEAEVLATEIFLGGALRTDLDPNDFGNLDHRAIVEAIKSLDGPLSLGRVVAAVRGDDRLRARVLALGDDVTTPSMARRNVPLIKDYSLRRQAIGWIAKIAQASRDDYSGADLADLFAQAKANLVDASEHDRPRTSP